MVGNKSGIGVSFALVCALIAALFSAGCNLELDLDRFRNRGEAEPATPPDVLTWPVTAITATSATTGGEIVGVDASVVLARGIVYGTQSRPSDDSSLGVTKDGEGIGSFRSSLEGLQPDTTYYVRAYAAAPDGTMTFGNEIVFETLPVVVPSADADTDADAEPDAEPDADESTGEDGDAVADSGEKGEDTPAAEPEVTSDPPPGRRGGAATTSDPSRRRAPSGTGTSQRQQRR